VEICTVGSVRGESVGLAMVDLNGHEAGNGGHSHGTPTAHRPLFYSERCPVSARTRSRCAREKQKGEPLSAGVFAPHRLPIEKGARKRGGRHADSVSYCNLTTHQMLATNTRSIDSCQYVSCI
jgi:hypothetical protein